jgi:sulfur carrier protein
MTITVAGVAKEVQEGLRLTELLELEQVETPEYVTISLNDDFVSTDNVPLIVLKEGDVIELLYFMGGGNICA